MKLIAVSKENNDLREHFFRAVFGEESGYIGVATKKKRGGFEQEFFPYPDNLSRLLEWVNQNLMTGDLYFCSQLFNRAKRSKEDAKICPNIWADLDAVDPALVHPKPSFLIETSPARYQALWLLDPAVDPPQGEDAARRTTYANNADSSGWDLTQLLRIPLTYNFKYPTTEAIVTIVDANNTHYKVEEFLELPEVPEFVGTDKPFPGASLNGMTAQQVLEKHSYKLLPGVFSLFSLTPDSDWSKPLWALQCLLLEAGLSLEETFVVCWEAACNKYERDDRSRAELWREICKSQVAVSIQLGESDREIALDSILTTEERRLVEEAGPTFVERYIELSASRSDAAKQYHEAGAFIILSTLLAESVRLKASFGDVIPNLWFMILGDTTLTRKTTAMEMAMEVITLVYGDAMLATDGSIEGILTALSQRSGRASLFWRDEFSGLLDNMKKRDYMSGMIEALTKMYDGKFQKRLLSKQVVEIREPIFMLFAGGIKSRILSMLDLEHIISGFIPRFVFIMADADITKFRPAGPATANSEYVTKEIINAASTLMENYNQEITVFIHDQGVTTKKVFPAQLTPEAWARYNQMEEQMVMAGVKSGAPEIYTPVMDRLAKSGLKAAVLIAASRQDPKVEGKVTVELIDILRAAKFVDSWKGYSIEVVENAGKSVNEKQVEMAYGRIRNGKNSRSSLMRTMHLSSRETDLILDTLEQRGMIIRSKSGKHEKLFPVMH